MKYLTWANNFFRSAAVSANQQTTNATSSKLQTSYLSEVWVSTGSNPEVTVDLGAGRAFDTIVVANHQLTSQADVTVMWGSSPTSLFQTVLPWREFDIAHSLSAVTSQQYLRLHFSDTNNPDNNISVGQIWIGSSGSTPMQFQSEWQDAEMHINRRQQTDAGIIHSEKLVRQHDISLLWSGLDHSQATTIWSAIVVDTNGGADPMWIQPKSDTEAHRHYICNLVDHDSSRTQHFLKLSLRFLESIRGLIKI